MALKDIWKDLQNAIEGVPNSGDDISADDINDIAHAVINLENDGGGSIANSINYSDIDNTFKCGVYIVDGRDGVSDDGRAEMLIVSSSDRGIGQFYFYDDGRIGYRQGSDSEWYTGFFNEIIDPEQPFATETYVNSAIGDALEGVY